MKTTILALEEQLRQAQIQGDVEALDRLISDDLQFVIQDGSVIGKEADLATHRSRELRIDRLDFTEQDIRLFGSVATVTVKASVAGSFSGKAFTGNFRYLRTWAQGQSSWRVISGGVVPLTF